MQETPPHTLMEIKLLLSKYLDGALDAEQVRQVEALLSTFPQYVSVLNKLQAARDAVRTSLGNQEQTLFNEEDQDSLWTSIASRLQADQETPTQAFDFDFVSAYYDGEIPTCDAQLVTFESQLYKNDQANFQLAQVDQVSQGVRQWAARLEAHCTLDIAEKIIQQFESEMTSSQVDIDEVPTTQDLEALECLSAYVDQALSPREVIEANRLIESNANAKLTLTRFNQIAAGLESISTQLQAQAPDLTAGVMAILAQDASSNTAVIDLESARQSRRKVYPWAKWGGLTAASVLLVTLLSSINWQDNTLESASDISSLPATALVNREYHETATAGPLATLSQASLKSSPSSTTRELASVPASSRLERSAGNYALPSAADDDQAVAAMRPVKASPRRVERIMDGLRGNRLASRAFPRPDIAPEQPRATAPSSEDYLFNALNEQMPGEDVSSILGK